MNKMEMALPLHEKYAAAYSKSGSVRSMGCEYVGHLRSCERRLRSEINNSLLYPGRAIEEHERMLNEITARELGFELASECLLGQV